MRIDWSQDNVKVRDRMVGGFTTLYAIDAYHHWCSTPAQGEVYNSMR
jgi:hypothetical protein